MVYSVGSPGSFKDSWVEDIPVSVRGPAGSGEGRIRLPIHPMEPAQVCKVEGAWAQSAAHAVNLGFETKLPLRLDCSHTSQGVRILHIDDRKVYNGQYWKTVRVESPLNRADGKSTVAPSAHFELMTAVLEPQAWPALLSRLQTPPSQKYDDLLAFELRYAVMPAGVEIALPIEIPVVFFPSWWIRTVSVLAGAALAWMICVLLNVFLPEARRRDQAQCLFTLVAGPGSSATDSAAWAADGGSPPEPPAAQETAPARQPHTLASSRPISIFEVALPGKMESPRNPGKDVEKTAANP